ncbi:MAG: SRPBCC family protein [Phycisphaerales bacterium]|nr:SRPBCC family protein [Phycisphaerales bacterium]
MTPATVDVTREGPNYRLRAVQWIPQPIDAVFAFFADARNLQVITPPWLSFTVVTPGEIAMTPGTRIDYRLRIRGLPIRWQSEITTWEPPHRFVDEMRRGPYRRWHHTHAFEPHDGGTLARDEVQYQVPGGAIVHALLVGPDVKRIFHHRQQKLAEIFNEALQP